MIKRAKDFWTVAEALKERHIKPLEGSGDYVVRKDDSYSRYGFTGTYAIYKVEEREVKRRLFGGTKVKKELRRVADYTFDEYDRKLTIGLNSKELEDKMEAFAEDFRKNIGNKSVEIIEKYVR